MSNIEVAIGVFPSDVVRVLRQSCAVAKVPIRADIVECVGVGITGHHAQTVIISRIQSHLQSVVVGSVDVAHLKNIAQVRKLAIVRTSILIAVRVGHAGGGIVRPHRRLVDISNSRQV